MAKPKITKSPVLSKEKFHPGRTSSHVFLSSDIPLLQKIDNIVYSYLGIPIENYENLQVVNYKSTENMMLTMMLAILVKKYVKMILKIEVD